VVISRFDLRKEGPGDWSRRTQRFRTDDSRAASSHQAARRFTCRWWPGRERDLLALRSGAPWADVSARCRPSTTIYNRFNRWRRAMRAIIIVMLLNGRTQW